MGDAQLAPRNRIIHAATRLLSEGGREAVSTRAVSAAAGVQAPTIYRHFGDMRGLLDEVAIAGFADYLASKASQAPAEDPVDGLRRGWDMHVDFGLANPSVYTLIYVDPRPGTVSSVSLKSAEILRGLVRAIGEAGRLRVGVEPAARMVHAAGVGVVLSLIGVDVDDRDPSLSHRTREAVLSAIVTTPGPAVDGGDAHGPSRIANRAVALKVVLSDSDADLTAAEYGLLAEWLDRLSCPPSWAGGS